MKYVDSTSGVSNGFTLIIFSSFRVSLPDSEQKGFQDHLPINFLISLLLFRNRIKSSSTTGTLSEITANLSNSVTPLLIARMTLSNARNSLSAKLTGRSANRTTPSASLTTLRKRSINYIFSRTSSYVILPPLYSPKGGIL